jgi:hypothetical protein
MGGLRGWFVGLTPRDRGIYLGLLTLLLVIFSIYTVAGVNLLRDNGLLGNGPVGPDPQIVATITASPPEATPTPTVPTVTHTSAPTATHTSAPTATHTSAPTATHTSVPSETPTEAPVYIPPIPTNTPSPLTPVIPEPSAEQPTSATPPTEQPTSATPPTEQPTTVPTAETPTAEASPTSTTVFDLPTSNPQPVISRTREPLPPAKP